MRMASRIIRVRMLSRLKGDVNGRATLTIAVAQSWLANSRQKCCSGPGRVCYTGPQAFTRQGAAESR